jgi:hypothetical protein
LAQRWSRRVWAYLAISPDAHHRNDPVVLMLDFSPWARKVGGQHFQDKLIGGLASHCKWDQRAVGIALMAISASGSSWELRTPGTLRVCGSRLIGSALCGTISLHLVYGSLTLTA